MFRETSYKPRASFVERELILRYRKIWTREEGTTDLPAGHAYGMHMDITLTHSSKRY
jgi:hypothetical protein